MRQSFRQALWSFHFLSLVLFGMGFCYEMSQGWAVSAQVEFMRSFQSEKILFPSDDSEYSQSVPGRYPVFLNWIFQDLLRWKPTGQPGFLSEACSWNRWRGRLQSRNPQVLAQKQQEYLNLCGSELETGVTSPFLQSTKVLSVYLDLNQNPFLHRVVFQLPSGQKLKGRLALKGDLKKRPLVIFRLGVCSNSEEFFAERFVLMMLFDQSIYNVLVLENSSGADSIYHNQRKFFGGYDEGLQNIWVAKTLKDPAEPLSQLVSTIHMVAISLGGHGMYLASLLNDFNLISTGPQSLKKERPIENFVGLCPVVDLQKRFQDLSAPGFKGMVINEWMSRRLVQFKNIDSRFQDWSWTDFFQMKPDYLPKVIRQVQEDFDPQVAKKLSIQWPKGLSEPQTFWEAQNFWPAYQNVKSPVVSWGTEQDLLVPWAENSGRLKKENIGLALFKQGNHCTLPAGYDWSILSHLLDQNIRNFTRNVKLKTETLPVELSKNYEADANSWMIDQMDWVEDNSRAVDLWIKNRNYKDQSVHILIPIDRFDFRFRNSAMSQAEKDMLTRWIFQNVNFKNKGEGKNKKLFLSWDRLDS